MREDKLRFRRRIAFSFILFLLLFLAMGVYMTDYAARHKEELFDNEYNTRQELQRRSILRGAILDRDGDELAYSRETEEGTERIYPYGALFAHTVGYASHGRSGIESLENYHLLHSSLPLRDRVDASGSGERLPGDQVMTTLDLKITEAADRALGVYKGAVMVSDVTTGEVLAMVSKPGFDPNALDEIWDTLMQQEEGDAELLNRVTQGRYPPGSVFKIVDAVGYLEEHPEDYANYRFQCGGTYYLGDASIHCYHHEAHGSVDFTQSFARSCNSSFANIGAGLDRQHFMELLDRMQFDKELPWDLPYSPSHVLLKVDSSDKELLQMTIGQGEGYMSPLHVNLITQAVANDGILMQPYMVRGMRDGAGRVLWTQEPREYAKLMDEETARAVQQLMATVVERGTATKLSGYGYTAAGKTGSAEYGDSAEDAHAWFTGFAPVESPRYAVTVIVEGAGTGGDYAVPVARRVFDACFGE